MDLVTYTCLHMYSDVSMQLFVLDLPLFAVVVIVVVVVVVVTP